MLAHRKERIDISDAVANLCSVRCNVVNCDITHVYCCAWNRIIRNAQC